MAPLLPVVRKSSENPECCLVIHELLPLHVVWLDGLWIEEKAAIMLHGQALLHKGKNTGFRRVYEAFEMYEQSTSRAHC